MKTPIELHTIVSKKFILCAFITTISFLHTSLAQNYILNTEISKITINGTSNTHDFECVSTKFRGLIITSNNKATSMEVEIPVESIKSGNKLMDSKTYETFDSRTHPNITFKLKEIKSFKEDSSSLIVSLIGHLTMAGKTKDILLIAKGLELKTGIYRFSGKTSLLLSEFGMKPPTAFIGLMKVNNQVTVSFDVCFEKK